MKTISLIFALLLSTITLAEESDFRTDENQYQPDYIAKINLLGQMSLDKNDQQDDDEDERDYITSDNPLYGGFNDLVRFVLPAPYQQGAGSCLYMAHTGVIEWWMNKRAGKKKYDLAERYYMSLKTEKTGQERVKNWRTDNIERLNEYQRMYLNKDYPFTKGHYKKVDGKRVVASEDDPKAKYGTRFNWISFRSTLPEYKSIKLPKFKREVIFADPQKNQWNITTAPKDIVTKIKRALVKNKAPVLVIYNHKGFWHANYIFGYNDRIKHNCPFTDSFEDSMIKKAIEYEKKASEATRESTRKKYLATAKTYRERGAKVSKRYYKNGGCSKKGAFYVRDSIYPNEDMPMYDYNTAQNDDDKNLNASLILREYEWVDTTLNHAIQIFPL